MRFSVAKELITPDWSVSMAGYASRTKTSIGIYDELYSRSLMLDDGNKKLLIISLDVCEADFELVSRIKRLVNAKFGLHEEDIIVHTNHTHAGPVTFAAQCSSSSAVDDAIKYSKLLEEKVMKNVDDCMSSSREGCLEIGTGETCIGMSRRQKTKEGYRIGPNPEEEIDREAYAIVIKDTSEKIHAVLFSCPCHPVVLYPRNLYISGDFPGVACKEMERRYPGSTAMFLQGSGADINPAILAADDDYRDTFYSDVIFTGKALANDISNIILRGTHKIKLSLDTCMERVPLRLNKNTNAETGDKVHDERRNVKHCFRSSSYQRMCEL